MLTNMLKERFGLEIFNPIQKTGQNQWILPIGLPEEVYSHFNT